MIQLQDTEEKCKTRIKEYKSQLEPIVNELQNPDLYITKRLELMEKKMNLQSKLLVTQEKLIRMLQNKDTK